MLPTQVKDFLADLEANNNRDWFQANQAAYQTFKKSYLDFTSSLLQRMKAIDPALAHLEPKDCVFRINRDIRFSKDKRPYKTHLGIGLAPGGKKLAMASYYLHIGAEESFVGGGIYMPPADVLQKIRREIDVYGDQLTGILSAAAFKKYYKDLDTEPGQKLTRPPKGYDPENPMIEYLKLKSFTAVQPFAYEKAFQPGFEDYVIEGFKAIQPFLKFLNDGLQAQAEEDQQPLAGW